MDETDNKGLYELKWLNSKHGQIPLSDCVSNIGSRMWWEHNFTFSPLPCSCTLSFTLGLPRILLWIVQSRSFPLAL